MTVQGKLSTMGIGDLLQWAHMARRSGVLVVQNAGKEERRIVFEGGRLAASSTSTQREYFGRFAAAAGYCTGADVDKALAMQRETGYSVAAILVLAGRMTESQAKALLEEKAIDAACDIFLWPDGNFHFGPEVTPPRKAIRIDLDPTTIVLEGFRRLDEWNRLTAMIHAKSVFETTQASLVEDSTWEDLVMAKRLLPHIDGAASVVEIIEGAPYGVYRTYRAFSELLARGLIRSAETTGFAARDRHLNDQMTRARRAQDSGNFAEALKILEGLTVSHPARPEISAELVRAVENFRSWVYTNTFVPRDVPTVAIPFDRLGQVKLAPRDAFLLSRIDGHSSVSDILRISAMKEVEAMEILKRLYDAHVIDFPTRRAAGA